MAFNRFTYRFRMAGCCFFTNSDGCFAPLSGYGAVFRKLWQKKPACIKFQFDIQINFGFSFKFKLPNQFFPGQKETIYWPRIKINQCGAETGGWGKGGKKEKNWRCFEISLLKSGGFFCHRRGCDAGECWDHGFGSGFYRIRASDNKSMQTII